MSALTTVPSSELVCGDVLLLAEGDHIGADARLVEANNLRVKESSLTGESESMLKDVRALDELPPLAERHNMVHKGTSVVQGTGVAIVTATGMHAEMGAVAHLLNTPPRLLRPCN